MKRLVAAAILIFLVVGIYLSGYFYVESVCQKTNLLIEECLIAYKSGEDVNDYTTKLVDFWAEKEDSLSLFINHDSIDEIELTIKNFAVHGKYRKNDMFYEHYSTLDMLLHQIKEDTVFGIHSIF